jgi:hypothetical protein
MKNSAKSDYWIKFTSKALTFLNKHADLNNPETVRAFIAALNTSNGYKRNLCLAYNKYCQHYKSARVFVEDKKGHVTHSLAF